MPKSQGRALDRKKLLADPILVAAIIGIFLFLFLFILYPLAILLTDSVVVEKNRRLAQENIELNHYITQEAWDRLPHIKEKLSEISRNVPSERRFGYLWTMYPEYAQELAEMKRTVAAEIRGANKKK